MKISFFKLSVSVTFAILMFNSYTVKAQFEEKIDKKCKGLEYGKRTRIVVGSFKASTSSAIGKFSGELPTMLSNALVATECFIVVANTKSNILDDIKTEKEYNRSGNVSAESSVEEGQELGAQLVITGEVTEFSEGKDGVSLGPVNLGKTIAKVGFVIQIADIKTKSIIFSKSLNAEASAQGGFSGAKVFGIPVAGSVKTRAMADAVEKAILNAVEIIVAQKEKIQGMPQGGVVTQSTEKKSVIKVENIDFGKLGALTTAVKGYLKVKDATKSLKEGVGTITVIHEGSFDELADFLVSKAAGYEVTGADAGVITLKAK